MDDPIREMKTFTLDIDGSPSIKFFGEEIAEVQEQDRGLGGCEWLTLYKTSGGSFVCHKVKRIGKESNRDIDSKKGLVCRSAEEVTEFFGYDDLSRELYEKAGIDYWAEVD